jgi:hypothetical protein
MAAADHSGPGPDLYQLLRCPGMPPGRRSRRPGGAGPGTSIPMRDRVTRRRPAGSGPWPRPGRCSATRPGGPPMEDARLAGPALRYLARDQGRPW